MRPLDWIGPVLAGAVIAVMMALAVNATQSPHPKPPNPTALCRTHHGVRQIVRNSEDADNPVTDVVCADGRAFDGLSR